MTFKFSQMFKTIVLFCFIFMLGLPIFSVTRSADVSVDSITADMYRFAQNELPGILEQIPVSHEKKYGFSNREEFKKVKLGIPYQEFSLDEEVPTGYWRLPVTIDGENRALLRLKAVDGEWTFSGFGAARLARELGFFENNYTKSKPSWGRIVRDFTMQCDYVQFEPKDLSRLGNLLHPMESAAKLMLRTSSAIDSRGYPVQKIRAFRSAFTQLSKNDEENSGSAGTE